MNFRSILLPDIATSFRLDSLRVLALLGLVFLTFQNTHTV